MNHQLKESLDRLVTLFASARERERSEEALRRWNDACSRLEAARASGAPGLDGLRACLSSIEWIVRCWVERGFEGSYRLAGDLVEIARAGTP